MVGIWAPWQAEPLAQFPNAPAADIWGKKNLPGVNFVVRELSNPPTFTSPEAQALQHAHLSARGQSTPHHAHAGPPPGGSVSGYIGPTPPGAIQPPPAQAHQGVPRGSTGWGRRL